MTSTTAGRTAPLTPTWLVATIAGLFGLFYAYVVWSAVALLVSSASSPMGLSGTGWLVLIFAVLFPILVFAGAFSFGWRRHWWEFALILLAGLALVAVFWINVVAFAASASTSLFAG